MNYMVNLVVATFNRLNLTKQSLPNIFETASKNIPFMLSVIDNGSIDGTQEYLQNLFNEKKINNLILLPKNIGVAKAHNILWKKFNHVPIYAKIDNDVIFNKTNWMDDIIVILDNCPLVGALGYNVEHKNLYPVTNENNFSYRYKQGNIGGACFFIPKRVNEKLGFWYEGYDLYGEEDADYGSRIMSIGLRNAYMTDESVMTHLPEEDKEYQKFKSKQRKDNLDGPWIKSLSDYSRKINLFRDSNSVNEIEYKLQTNL